jgi:hypothetical protein
MAKQSKDTGPRRIEITIGSSGRSRTSSLMAPSDKGRRVNLRPSDRAVGEMRARGVTHVRGTWEVNASGEVEWLELRPVKPGEEGLKIRYDNGGLRPHVHLPTADVGRAVDAPSGTRVCPQETTDGDAFRFKVPDGLRFEKGGETNARA